MVLVVPVADILLYIFLDASFAESLYGLRRRGVKIRVKKSNVPKDSGEEIHHSGLHKHQKVLSVVFLVNNLFSYWFSYHIRADYQSLYVVNVFMVHIFV